MDQSRDLSCHIKIIRKVNVSKKGTRNSLLLLHGFLGTLKMLMVQL